MLFVAIAFDRSTSKLIFWTFFFSFSFEFSFRIAHQAGSCQKASQAERTKKIETSPLGRPAKTCQHRLKRIRSKCFLLNEETGCLKMLGVRLHRLGHHVSIDEPAPASNYRYWPVFFGSFPLAPQHAASSHGHPQWRILEWAWSDQIPLQLVHCMLSLSSLN